MSERQTKVGNQECSAKLAKFATLAKLAFTHSRHAEQLLFSCLGSKVTVYSQQLQLLFLTSFTSSSLPSPVSLEFRAGSKLKTMVTPEVPLQSNVSRFNLAKQSGNHQ